MPADPQMTDARTEAERIARGTLKRYGYMADLDTWTAFVGELADMEMARMDAEKRAAAAEAEATRLHDELSRIRNAQEQFMRQQIAALQDRLQVREP